MSTGNKRVNVYLKKFLPQQQFRENLQLYLQKMVEDFTAVMYATQGVFGNSSGLLSPSASPNSFNISTPTLGTDGIGHIVDLDPSQALNIPFENALGVQYWIGLRFNYLDAADVQTTETNVRTGKFEYVFDQEAIGEIADPNLVVDNGTTLTLRVNSVTESGVNNAGRTVRVYLKPRQSGGALGPLSEATPYEDVLVTFNGGNNQITTTGLLGQAIGSVSTDPNNYRCVLLGATVKRNTNLTLDPNVIILGYVIGTGVGNVLTPGDINQDDRVVLQQLGAPIPPAFSMNILVEGGGTLSHSDTTIGLMSWSDPIKVRPLGTNQELTIAASNITLADDEVAYISIPDPFISGVVVLLKVARSAITLSGVDKLWIMHRDAGAVNIRGGMQIEQGEQRQLEDIVINNAIFFSNNDRIRYSDSDNIYHLDADGVDDTGNLALGSQLFFGTPASNNKLIYAAGVLSFLFNNGLDGASIKSGLFNAERTSALSEVFKSKATGDAQQRFIIDADGLISWGDGTAALDISIMRDAIGRLVINGDLRISGSDVLFGLAANNDSFRFVDGVTPVYEFISNAIVQFTINELGDALARRDLKATRDVLSAAGVNYKNALAVDIATNASLNQTHDETLFRKLLKIIPNNPSNSIINISASRITAADGSNFVLPSGLLISDYLGGTANFSTGAQTGGGLGFVPHNFVGNASKWAKYSLNLLADNTILVLPASGVGVFGTTKANALNPPLVGNAISFAIVAVQDNGVAGIGTILGISEINIDRLPAAGGAGGAGNIKATFIDPISTTLPTGLSITIDGIAGANDDLVLFTKLALNNNRIYKLSGIGVGITWTAQNAFQGQYDPEDGDSVRIQKGLSFSEQLAIFDSINFKVNDIVRLFDGISADYVELGSIKTVNLVNNTINGVVFSVSVTNNENWVVNYSIIRGAGQKETGQLLITSDGITASISNTNSYFGDTGVTFNVDINAGNIRLLYTTTNTGIAAIMKLFVARWANSAGGPSGIPNYNTSPSSSIVAAGVTGDIQYKNSSGNLAGDNRFKWDEAEGFINLNGLKYKALQGPVVLLDNQVSPQTAFSYDISNKFAIVEYSILRNTSTSVGRLLITTNGGSVSISDDSVFIGTPGITFSASISGSDVIVQYVSTNMGFNADFKYTFRRWS